MEVSEFWQRKGCSSLTAGLSPRLSFFFLENPSFGMLTTLKIAKRFDFTQKMVRKLKFFTINHRKVIYSS